MDELKLIDTREAARLLGLSKSALEHDRLAPRMRIPYVRLGGSVRYDPAALLAWARAQMVHAPEPQAQPTPQPQPLAPEPQPPRRRGRPRKAI